MSINVLNQEVIRKILGKVEIATIIKKIQGKKLKQTERNYLYRSIRPKLIAANILASENILKDLSDGHKKVNSLIEFNLSHYGYELISVKKWRQKVIPLEELIIKILLRPKARYIEAIPILIIKNKLNKLKLLELASINGIKNKIGYLLETVMMIKEINYLKDLLAYLKETKDKNESFLTGGDYEFLSRESPKRIRKWNLLGRFFDEDFFRNAEAYL
jgi:hypothetical protein